MNIFSKPVFRIFIAAAVTVAAGCSSIPGMDQVLPDRKVEYKKSKEAKKNLEVPPDLTASSINDDLVVPTASAAGSATLSSFEQTGQQTSRISGRSEVLPEMDNIQFMRDGDQRWLLIQAQPEDVWFKVVDFWQESGVLLQEQDPAAGVMVTDWLEVQPNIKLPTVTGWLSKAVSGLHSASTRDQYRVRIEPGSTPDDTELYLTHRGMQETIIQDGGGDVERTVWNPRETDHGLEAEMLRRLMVSLGIAEQQATRAVAAGQSKRVKSRSRLNQIPGNYSLTILEDFDRSWRLTGVALDRVGFAVEDRNRSAGVYYVRYNDPLKDAEEEGWLSKLAFWDNDKKIDKVNQYQVSLNSSADNTEVVVLNEAGERDNTDTALRILTLLSEQIR